MTSDGKTLHRVAVVTGGNRGIGLEICRQLAKLGGIHVVLTARDKAKAGAAAKKLRDEGLDVDSLPLDVTSGKSIRALADSMERLYKRCDVLVNNAGVMLDPRGSRVPDSKVQTWHETLETNLIGPLLTIQGLVPLMRKNGYGRIVNVSSGQGQLSDMGVGTPAYRVSKSALNALTRTFAAEMKGSGILVNSMCPGWVKTDMGGPGAPVTPKASAEGLRRVIAALKPSDSGAFLNYDGAKLPW